MHDELVDASANDTMWPTVPRLLARHRYLVLGTVNPNGEPWVTPVFFVADGTNNVICRRR